MSLAGGDNERNISAIAVLALFLSFSSFSVVNLVTRPVACFPGDIGTSKCPLSGGGTSLGTWYHFPSSCPTQDSCELFGNNTYRTVFTAGNNTATTLSGYAAFLVVNCVVNSNVAGAYLQLQYALYNIGGPAVSSSNSTNWQNLGTVDIGLFISLNSPCLVSNGSPTNTPATSRSILLNQTICSGGSGSCGYIFRVLGQHGGGASDNPRFSFIGVGIENTGSGNRRIYTAEATQKTIGPAGGFTYQLYSYPAVTSSTAVSFVWTANNVSSGGTCGIGATATSHCWESNTSSCTFAAGAAVCPSAGSTTINYGMAFTGTVKTFIQITTTSAPASTTIPVLTVLTMFSVQTETV
jgi:hypothetical protein